jgi:hypothetical protein
MTVPVFYGTLQRSKQLTSCPHPHRGEASPYLPILFPKENLQYYPHIYSDILVSFPQASPPKSCMNFSSPTCVPHAPASSSTTIRSLEYLASTNNEAHHYAIFSSPVTLSLLGPTTFLSTLFLNTLSLRSFNARVQSSQPYKTDKITGRYALYAKQEDIRF